MKWATKAALTTACGIDDGGLVIGLQRQPWPCLALTLRAKRPAALPWPCVCIQTTLAKRRLAALDSLGGGLGGLSLGNEQRQRGPACAGAQPCVLVCVLWLVCPAGGGGICDGVGNMYCERRQRRQQKSGKSLAAAALRCIVTPALPAAWPGVALVLATAQPWLAAAAAAALTAAALTATGGEEACWPCIRGGRQPNT